MNIKNVLYKNFRKVLLIDAATGTYISLKPDSDDIVHYKGIDQWFITFANSSALWQADRTKFLQVANMANIKLELEIKDEVFVLYRKLIDYEVHKCIMKISKVTNDKFLLTVEDLERYGKEIRAGINKIADIDFSSYSSIGAIVIEYNPDKKNEIIDIFNYYYPATGKTDIFYYDINKTIIIEKNIGFTSFYFNIAELYKNLGDVGCYLGYIWLNEKDIEEHQYSYTKILNDLFGSLASNKSKNF